MNEPDLVAEAARWLRFAREDLETAEALLESERLVPRHACLLAVVADIGMEETSQNESGDQ